MIPLRSLVQTECINLSAPHFMAEVYHLEYNNIAEEGI